MMSTNGAATAESEPSPLRQLARRPTGPGRAGPLCMFCLRACGHIWWSGPALCQRLAWSVAKETGPLPPI